MKGLKKTRWFGVLAVALMGATLMPARAATQAHMAGVARLEFDYFYGAAPPLSGPAQPVAGVFFGWFSAAITVGARPDAGAIWPPFSDSQKVGFEGMESAQQGSGSFDQPIEFGRNLLRLSCTGGNYIRNRKVVTITLKGCALRDSTGASGSVKPRFVVAVSSKTGAQDEIVRVKVVGPVVG